MHVLRNEFGYTKTKLRTKFQKPSMSKEMRSPGFVSRIKVVVDTHLLCRHTSYKDGVIDIKRHNNFCSTHKIPKIKHGSARMQTA